jgi:Stage II sporulation protein E (SpoIIE)
MTNQGVPGVAGIDASPNPSAPRRSGRADGARPIERLAAGQDQLASWLSDLTTLHELSERLVKADSLDTTLYELLQAGAALVGAQRGIAVLEPADGRGPETTVGLGLERHDLGTLETVPREAAIYGRTMDAEMEGGDEVPPDLVHADIAADLSLPARHREVAAQLGIGASYAQRLATEGLALGAVVWMYDEPAEPTDRQRHLAHLYCSFAAELVAKQLRHTRVERDARILRESLLPPRLPHLPGVRLGVRHRGCVEGGGDWYDALALPEGALGLSVGGVTGSGPHAAAAMGRLRSALRAYAVMEGEDPVAVLSDLEVLLHVTEPARSATALFAYVEPELRRVVLAGAGHCPPLLLNERRVEYVETSLSAPLGMLTCWEAPSAELTMGPGETLVLYTDGLLHRIGGTLDQAFAKLRTAAARAPREAREDPDALCEHLLATCLPDSADTAPVTGPAGEDIVLLAARLD